VPYKDLAKRKQYAKEKGKLWWAANRDKAAQYKLKARGAHICKWCGAPHQDRRFTCQACGVPPRGKKKPPVYKHRPKPWAKTGPCEICGVVCKLVRDHCHLTQLYRGMLCSRCNLGIGHFKDCQTFLRNAAWYLETYDRKE
jgi:hypothetical protein